MQGAGRRCEIMLIATADCGCLEGAVNTMAEPNIELGRRIMRHDMHYGTQSWIGTYIEWMRELGQ